MNEDYRLFERVTDPAYTKRVKVAGKPEFVNIDTYYLIQEASKEFGLFGKTWGLKSLEYETHEFGDTVLLVLMAVFFFPDGEFPIANSIKIAYKTNQGYMKVNEDAYKSVETNTIAKALSRIGFGTDVYLGLFDSEMYVAQAYADANLEKEMELATQKQKDEILFLMGETESDEKKMLSFVKIGSLEELTVTKYEVLKNALQQKRQRMLAEKQKGAKNGE